MYLKILAQPDRCRANGLASRAFDFECNTLVSGTVVAVDAVNLGGRNTDGCA